MKRTHVNSSNIAEIGYDIATQTLEIKFNNGMVYQYFDVPDHINTDIMHDTSHGEYLAQHIKGVYRYSKV